MINLRKLSNWVWIGFGILFLILAYKIGKESNKKEIQINKITPIETAIPTKIITPTKIEDFILVTKIIDGDTLMVKINDEETTVRLIGIDTPESGQCFGKEATNRAKELMENKKVKLEADETQDDKDKYGRLLRYIYLEDGTLINKKLIEDGVAKEYTYKMAYKFQTEFKSDQKVAQEKKLGIWADDACPTPTIKTITPTVTKIENVLGETENNNSAFVCDCKKSCTKISSCEEAYFQLNNCGCSERDGNEDGVPCESLCN